MLKQNKKDPKQFYFTTKPETEQFISKIKDEFEFSKTEDEEEIYYLSMLDAVNLWVYIGKNNRFKVLIEVKCHIPIFADQGEWLSFDRLKNEVLNGWFEGLGE